jgi:hypothetical protein
MGLFKDNKNIKNSKDLYKALKSERYLTPKERSLVMNKAKGLIKESSGMSKEEWHKKVVRPLMKNSKDKIDPYEARRLHKFGK